MFDTDASRTPGPAGSSPHPSPGARGILRVVVGALGAFAFVLGASACSDGPDLEREAAVTRIVDGSAGAIGRPQAECYVDQVTNELGAGVLAEGAEAEPEQVRRLTSIRIDCFGVASLGATTTVSGPAPRAVDGVVPQPMAYGEDPVLDALWGGCEAGSGEACDQLFDQAPVSSEYEQFAGTCGGRTQELSCAAVYSIPGDPATKVTSSSPSTSVP